MDVLLFADRDRAGQFRSRGGLFGEPEPETWTHWRKMSNRQADYDDSGLVVVGPLVKNVNNVSLPELSSRRKSWDDTRLELEEPKKREKRARDYANKRERRRLRSVAQAYTKASGVGKCGICRVLSNDVTVARSRSGSSGFLGLATCGSVWECPECQGKVIGRRRDELRQLMKLHRDRGGDAYMLTLTGPHDVGDELVPLRKKVSNCWRYVQGGKQWQRWRSRLGIVGTIRSLEVNHGPNGWHPHLHILILTERGDVDFSELEDWIYRRWVKAFTSIDRETGRSYRAPTREHGITLVRSRKDTYIQKLGLVDELARGSWKKPRGFLELGYRTPLQVLRDVADRRRDLAIDKQRPFLREDQRTEARGKLRQDVLIWTEYADGMRGARQLTWSRGLRERYELGPEQTELELLELEESKLNQVVYTIPAADWEKYVAHDVELQSDILDAAAEGNEARVTELVDIARGLEPIPF